MTRIMADNETVKLVLEDGTELLGSGFGAVRPTVGEVVFNTAMNGYVEALTDPSYRGQILVATYPLIGNYGVTPARSMSLAAPYESDKIQVQGLVVQHYVETFSHHSAKRSLRNWLVAEDIPAVTGIDTRALTRRLREYGTMRGWLFPANISLEQAQHNASSIDVESEMFDLVAPPQAAHYRGGDSTIMLVDIGAKDNIVRSLLTRGVSVLRVPWHAQLDRFAADADGILIGNGPGDPKHLGALVVQLRALLGWYRRPIFGICLGHQLLSLAVGGDTYKLAYGHRGVNQPVQDLLTRRCYITSQNHGYAVSDDLLPSDWEPWFANINDGTNEGIRCKSQPFFSVQFHPEAHPGPRDTEFLFNEFLRLVGSMRSYHSG
jgi:carbamoyl-phosphate synthase small subunit